MVYFQLLSCKLWKCTERIATYYRYLQYVTFIKFKCSANYYILSCTGFHWWEHLLTSVQCCIDFMVCCNCYCVVKYLCKCYYTCINERCHMLLYRKNLISYTVPLSQNSGISFLLVDMKLSTRKCILLFIVKTWDLRTFIGLVYLESINIFVWHVILLISFVLHIMTTTQVRPSEVFEISQSCLVCSFVLLCDFDNIPFLYLTNVSSF